MTELINKISKYHLFESFFPGALFLILFNYLIIPINTTNIYVIIIITYFTGLTISRIGSLVIAKILYLFTKVKGEQYKDYIQASKKDEMIETLLVDKNMYRSIVSCLSLIFILKIYKTIIKYNVNKDIIIIILLITLTILFSISFLKVNKTLTKRIQISKRK